MEYVFAPRGWNVNEPNPFVPDGNYDDRFSCFSTRGAFGFDMLTKRTEAGCWLVQYKAGRDDYRRELVNFIRYENANGRCVIIDTERPEEEIEATIGEGGKDDESVRLLVHSTEESGWERIRETGMIIAGAFLGSKPDRDDSPIGRYMAGEPKEYSQYVMLAEMESNGELILASRQYGAFVSDEDIEYRPGARLYFDYAKMRNDGIVVKDGLHFAKVFRELGIDAYLVGSFTTSDFPDTAKWTPKLFKESCNREMRRRT